jgi:hypothetical protein
MHLDLSDEETAALIKEPHDIVENDPYSFSPRIRTLRAIEARARTDPRALAAARLCATAGDGSEKASGRPIAPTSKTTCRA